MQILNITPMVRPFQYVTSLMYPIHTLSSMYMYLGMGDAVQRQVLNETYCTTSLGLDFGIQAATSREALNRAGLEDTIGLEFNIVGAQVLVDNKPPVYIPMNLQDHLDLQFSIAGAQITVQNKPPVFIELRNYISTVNLEFALLDAHITT